jgi:parallel beta-helix repeat protein
VAFILAATAPTLAGQIITVDDDGIADFNNIQAAIVDANNGDMIIVADGTYTGDGNHDIRFWGKAITVRSRNGPGNSVVDCEGVGTGFAFADNEDANSVLEGFTIKNGYSSVGGGIICSEGSPTITNCIISGNRASGYGGAMLIYESSPTLINCTIVDNIADGSVLPQHGGIYNGGENTILTNCIVWGNRAWGTPGIEENQIAGYNPVINYCCVEGWSGALGGTGNFGADPCFVEQGYWESRTYYPGDYHLLTDSHCIDAGDPNFVPALNAKDADGEPRIMGDRVDIGADEVGPKQPDLSRNGTINSEDFVIFTNSWRARPTDDNWYILSDFDRDDFIGFADLGILTNDWLWQASWYTP